MNLSLNFSNLKKMFLGISSSDDDDVRFEPPIPQTTSVFGNVAEKNTNLEIIGYFSENFFFKKYKNLNFSLTKVQIQNLDFVLGWGGFSESIWR